MHRAQILIDMLTTAGVAVQPGLSEDELRAVEVRFGFSFAPEHRSLLAAGLPVGERWPDWRHAPEANLREWLDWPRDGLLFDVQHNVFWPASWGQRPPAAEADDVARQRIARPPRLVPFHRTTPRQPPIGGRAVPFWSDLAEGADPSDH